MLRRVVVADAADDDGQPRQRRMDYYYYYRRCQQYCCSLRSVPNDDGGNDDDDPLVVVIHSRMPHHSRTESKQEMLGVAIWHNHRTMMSVVAPHKARLVDEEALVPAVGNYYRYWLHW